MLPTPLWPPRLGQAEVENFHSPILGHHYVVRLQVPMGDARPVCGSQAFGDLRANVEYLAQWQLSSAQRGALHQLHYHVAIADIEDTKNIGVIQRSQNLGFLLKAGAAGRVASEVRGQNLQRNITPQPRVARPVDLAHAARAQRRDDFIRSEFVSRDERHVIRSLLASSTMRANW